MLTFKNRYLIKGILTVETPLHIGSGETTTHPKLITETGEHGKRIEISAVAKDAQNKPYIPASTLKGNLRAWLETRVDDKSLVELVFGHSPKEANQEDGHCGKIDFWDAHLAGKCVIANPEQRAFPYWDEERQTGVQVGVTIDRQTRTAREERLFHWEIVPPGLRFEVHLTGENLKNDELALLLAGLEGFNDEKRPVMLGSETAQNQGKMRWQSSEAKIQCLDQEAVRAWLEEPDDEQRGMWFKAIKPVNQSKQAQLMKLGNKLITSESNRPTLRLVMRLKFDTPFLVNDPSKEKEGVHNFQPRRDAKGRVLLPAKSMRGAVRAQAERIIRTLNGKAAGLVDETYKANDKAAGLVDETYKANDKAACCVDDKKSACKPIQSIEEVDGLCLACQLFGATGWQTPIRISDFSLVESQGEFDQDFVAIDRFTGGGSEGAKFRARVTHAPLLEGHWDIDLKRVKLWGLGLLALVIRDLTEGDVTFGYGAAKGYGHARLTIQDYSINTLENCFIGEVDWQGLNPAMPNEWQKNHPELLRTFIKEELVEAFREKCRDLESKA
jgi:CRISPR/Cas system CSM-associated protein Csm3 (group 7 of RAMP superfamily)